MTLQCIVLGRDSRLKTDLLGALRRPFGSEQHFLCTYLLSVGANAFMWRNMTESSPKQQQVINVFGWSNT